MSPLLECVPNFSEGRDSAIIRQITDQIQAIKGVKLLHVDSGQAANRTVVTFVGKPEAVIEAAFQAIRTAAELIDMSTQKGEHPRIGATDVCPLIPISGISMEEAADYARQLGERVGKSLSIPVYLYEAAASRPERRNLATVRAGEYEGLPKKLQDPNWIPDYGPHTFNARAGATVIGARDFLIAYNVNLNTTSVRSANSIAFDVREKGRLKRSGDPKTGPIVYDEQGKAVRIPGSCKGVKAIGWFIKEYGIAQVSMNITNIEQTALHTAFEAVRKSANQRSIGIRGSELIGMVPLRVLLDAGKYFLSPKNRSMEMSEAEIIHTAVTVMGLDDLRPFDPKQRIIEYQLEDR